MSGKQYSQLELYLAEMRNKSIMRMDYVHKFCDFHKDILKKCSNHIA